MTRLDRTMPTICARCGSTCTAPAWAKGMCPPCSGQYNAQRGSAHQRGYGVEHRRRRAEVLEPGAVCHWCGAPATQVDHVAPVARGGAGGPLVPACAPCNAGRTARIGRDGRPGGRGRVAFDESPPGPLPISPGASGDAVERSADGVDRGAVEGLIR